MDGRLTLFISPQRRKGSKSTDRGRTRPVLWHRSSIRISLLPAAFDAFAPVDAFGSLVVFDSCLCNSHCSRTKPLRDPQLPVIVVDGSSV